MVSFQDLFSSVLMLPGILALFLGEVATSSIFFIINRTTKTITASGQSPKGFGVEAYFGTRNNIREQFQKYLQSRKLTSSLELCERVNAIFYQD